MQAGAARFADSISLYASINGQIASKNPGISEKT
jgi:hypothetical protein